MTRERVAHEPAFVLHHHDWSESSLILEVFTRHHGRVALVAKGAKKPSSNFRPVLLPLQPLQLAYTVTAVAEDAIAVGARSLWLQLGVIAPEASALAADAGLKVVVDRCTKIEHAVLIGR